MKTPEFCPGCKTKLDPEALNCPSCPMSFSGEDDAEGPVNPFKGHPLTPYLFGLAFFAGLGWIIWALGGGLLTLGSQQSENLSFEPKPSTQTVEGVLHSANGAEPANAEEEAGPGVVQVVTSEEPAKRRRVKEWKLRGQVYDLVTLEPLPACDVFFMDNETNARAKTVTNSSGLYRIILPPLPDRGYLVEIGKSGYAARYLDPGTEGVPSMTPLERQDLARELAATVSGSRASVQAFDETPQVTNFYLAPKR